MEKLLPNITLLAEGRDYIVRASDKTTCFLTTVHSAS